MVSLVTFYIISYCLFRKKEDQSTKSHKNDNENNIEMGQSSETVSDLITFNDNDHENENSIEMRQSSETVACTVEDLQCQPETVNQSDQISNHSSEKSINRSKITIPYSTAQLFFQRWKDWALITSNNFLRKL